MASRALNGAIAGLGFGLINLLIWANYSSYAPTAYSHGTRGMLNLVVGAGLVIFGAACLISHFAARRSTP